MVGKISSFGGDRNGGQVMNEHAHPKTNTGDHAENRRHFLVDINTVFSLFGKRYFLIFYFGRHLHPRQRQQLVNQRRAGNWLVIVMILMLLAGAIYGIMELVTWRLGNSDAAPDSAGSFTQRIDTSLLRA